MLAVAEREASSRADLDDERVERLCLLGFLVLSDPVRPTAAQAVSDGFMVAHRQPRGCAPRAGRSWQSAPNQAC